MIPIKSCRKGFTLIEVLIVVVIIAALAAMVIPRFVGQVDRARAAEAFQAIGAIRKAAAQTYAITGVYNPNQNYGICENRDESNCDDGTWSDIGLKPFNIKSDIQIQYSPDGSAGYTAYVDLNTGANINRVTVAHVEATGVDTWTCKGIFKTKASGNGCTI